MEEMDETEVDAQVDLDYFLFHSHLRFLISIWLPRKYERAKSFHDHLICNRFEGKNEKEKKKLNVVEQFLKALYTFIGDEILEFLTIRCFCLHFFFL